MVSLKREKMNCNPWYYEAILKRAEQECAGKDKGHHTAILINEMDCHFVNEFHSI